MDFPTSLAISRSMRLNWSVKMDIDTNLVGGNQRDSFRISISISIIGRRPAGMEVFQVLQQLAEGDVRAAAAQRVRDLPMAADRTIERRRVKAFVTPVQPYCWMIPLNPGGRLSSLTSSRLILHHTLLLFYGNALRMDLPSFRVQSAVLSGIGALKERKGALPTTWKLQAKLFQGILNPVGLDLPLFSS